LQINLDENLGARGRQLLEQAGHDVATVTEQGLTSASDERRIDVCKRESPCLVTLDLDFSNPFLFPPKDDAGIAVIRLPRQPRPDDLFDALQTLVTALANDSIEGTLWSVERGRVRQYLPDEEE